MSARSFLLAFSCSAVLASCGAEEPHRGHAAAAPPAGALTHLSAGQGAPASAGATIGGHGGQSTYAREKVLAVSIDVPARDGFVTDAPLTPVLRVEGHVGAPVITLDGEPYVPGTRVAVEGRHELRVSATNRAGRTLSATRQFTIDLSDPRVELAPDFRDGITSQSPLHLVGAVRDLTACRLFVGDTQVDLLDGGGFSTDLPLVEGANTVRLAVLDAAARRTEITTRVVLDTHAPTMDRLTIGGVEVGEQRTIALDSLTPSISVAYTDTASGVLPSAVSVEAGGATVLLEGRPTQATGTLQLPGGSSVVRVRVPDRAGNVSERVFTVVTETVAAVAEDESSIVGAAIEVPASGLPADTALLPPTPFEAPRPAEVRVGQAALPGFAQAGPLVRFGPDGLLASRGAALTLPYWPEALGTAGHYVPPESFRVAELVNAAGVAAGDAPAFALVESRALIDPAVGTVGVTASHLGVFAVVAPLEVPRGLDPRVYVLNEGTRAAGDQTISVIDLETKRRLPADIPLPANAGGESLPFGRFEALYTAPGGATIFAVAQSQQTRVRGSQVVRYASSTLVQIDPSSNTLLRRFTFEQPDATQPSSPIIRHVAFAEDGSAAYVLLGDLTEQTTHASGIYKVDLLAPAVPGTGENVALTFPFAPVLEGSKLAILTRPTAQVGQGRPELPGTTAFVTTPKSGGFPGVSAAYYAGNGQADRRGRALVLRSLETYQAAVAGLTASATCDLARIDSRGILTNAAELRALRAAGQLIERSRTRCGGVQPGLLAQTLLQWLDRAGANTASRDALGDNLFALFVGAGQVGLVRLDQPAVLGTRPTRAPAGGDPNGSFALDHASDLLLLPSARPQGEPLLVWKRPLPAGASPGPMQQQAPEDAAHEGWYGAFGSQLVGPGSPEASADPDGLAPASALDGRPLVPGNLGFDPSTGLVFAIEEAGGLLAIDPVSQQILSSLALGGLPPRPGLERWAASIVSSTYGRAEPAGQPALLVLAGIAGDSAQTRLYQVKAADPTRVDWTQGPTEPPPERGLDLAAMGIFVSPDRSNHSLAATLRKPSSLPTATRPVRAPRLLLSRTDPAEREEPLVTSSNRATFEVSLEAFTSLGRVGLSAVAAELGDEVALSLFVARKHPAVPDFVSIAAGPGQPPALLRTQLPKADADQLVIAKTSAGLSIKRRDAAGKLVIGAREGLSVVETATGNLVIQGFWLGNLIPPDANGGTTPAGKTIVAHLVTRTRGLGLAAELAVIEKDPVPPAVALVHPAMRYTPQLGSELLLQFSEPTTLDRCNGYLTAPYYVSRASSDGVPTAAGRTQALACRKLTSKGALVLKHLLPPLGQPAEAGTRAVFTTTETLVAQHTYRLDIDSASDLAGNKATATTTFKTAGRANLALRAFFDPAAHVGATTLRQRTALRRPAIDALDDRLEAATFYQSASADQGLVERTVLAHLDPGGADPSLYGYAAAISALVYWDQVSSPPVPRHWLLFEDPSYAPRLLAVDLGGLEAAYWHTEPGPTTDPARYTTGPDRQVTFDAALLREVAWGARALRTGLALTLLQRLEDLVAQGRIANMPADPMGRTRTVLRWIDDYVAGLEGQGAPHDYRQCFAAFNASECSSSLYDLLAALAQVILEGSGTFEGRPVDRAGLLDRLDYLAHVPANPLAGLVPPDPIPTTVAVGEIPGAFSVTDGGAATYTIPIAAPPAPGGTAPSLALSYSSQGGDGPLGVRWGVSGLSAISRCPRDTFRDRRRGIGWRDDDAYCWDGQRMATVGPNEWRLERDNFTRIRRVEDLFVATTKEGQTLTFSPQTLVGIESTRHVRGLSVAESNTSYVWALRSVRDPLGQGHDIRYVAGTHAGLAPERVTYGGWSIDFLYDGDSLPSMLPACPSATNQRACAADDAACALDGYVSGTALGLGGGLLRAVRVTRADSGNAGVVRAYGLCYSTGASGAKHLDSVTECPAIGACKLPTSFEWLDEEPLFDAPLARNGEVPQEVALLEHSYTRPIVKGDPGSIFVVDIDGDGKHEVIYRALGEWRLIRSRATLLDTETILDFLGSRGQTKLLPLDIDGDGKIELIAQDPHAPLDTGDPLPIFHIEPLLGIALPGSSAGGSISIPASTFVGCSPDTASPGCQALVHDFSQLARAVDLDGDGLPEVLACDWASGAWRLFQQGEPASITMTGTHAGDRTCIYSHRDRDTGAIVCDQTTGLVTHCGENQSVVVHDLDGDGADDLQFVDTPRFYSDLDHDCTDTTCKDLPQPLPVLRPGVPNWPEYTLVQKAFNDDGHVGSLSVDPSDRSARTGYLFVNHNWMHWSETPGRPWRWRPGAFPEEPVAAHLNRDAITDLVTSTAVLAGTGARPAALGSFQELGIEGRAGNKALVADLTGDGLPEVARPYPTPSADGRRLGETWIYNSQRGGRTLLSATGPIPYHPQIQMLDADGDGVLDLLLPRRDTDVPGWDQGGSASWRLFRGRGARQRDLISAIRTGLERAPLPGSAPSSDDRPAWSIAYERANPGSSVFTPGETSAAAPCSGYPVRCIRTAGLVVKSVLRRHGRDEDGGLQSTRMEHRYADLRAHLTGLGGLGFARHETDVFEESLRADNPRGAPLASRLASQTVRSLFNRADRWVSAGFLLSETVRVPIDDKRDRVTERTNGSSPLEPVLLIPHPANPDQVRHAFTSVAGESEYEGPRGAPTTPAMRLRIAFRSALPDELGNAAYVNEEQQDGLGEVVERNVSRTAYENDTTNHPRSDNAAKTA